LFCGRRIFTRLLLSDVRSLDSSVKLHHRKSASDSNESDPVRDAAPLVHRDANYKPETSKMALWRDRIDGLAIERAEDEGMTVRAE
jgi:hypothetical protein